MRKLMIAFMALFLVACTGNTAPAEKNMADEYTELAKENVFKYASQNDVIAMLEHGSGAVFFGFPECPFCHAYAPMLNEAVKDTGLSVLYYNILEDRKDNTEFYQKVTKILDGHLDYDSDGKNRIYVPDITFVIKGEVIGHDNESSMLNSEEISPKEYWDEEKSSALKTKLHAWAVQTAEARAAAEKEGCDTGCEVKP